MAGVGEATFKWKQPLLQMESNNLLPRGWLLLGYETWTWMKLHFTDLKRKKKKDQNSPCCSFICLFLNNSVLKKHREWKVKHVEDDSKKERMWRIKCHSKPDWKNPLVLEKSSWRKGNKIPNRIGELLDCITINTCQAKLVKLNYFDSSVLFLKEIICRMKILLIF